MSVVTSAAPAKDVARCASGLRARLGLAAVVLVLACGAGLKVLRYAGDGAGPRAAAVAHVEAVMRAHGWRPNGTARIDGGVYEQFAFRREGCPSPVVVALLGGNAEGAHFLRRLAGGDVMFVQDGEVVDQPSGLRRQWDILGAHVARVFGTAASQRLPVLAITPAASARTANDAPDPASACKGPPRAAWRISSLRPVQAATFP